jgi:hypothetical protein
MTAYLKHPIAADTLSRRELEVQQHLQERAVRSEHTDTGVQRRNRLGAWLASRPHRRILRPA